MSQQFKKIKLVFILSASHSGSTLLAFLLGAHPEVCTVGELKLTALGSPEHYRCSCREFIRACPFWQQIQQCMTKKGYPFEINNPGIDIRSGASPYVNRLLNPLHRNWWMEALRDIGLGMSSNWRQNYPLIQARNLALIQCVSQTSGKRIIVDSSKIGIRLKYLKRLKEIDLRVIRLIRDGRGVALTYMDPERFADAREPSLRGGGTGKSRVSQRLSLERAVLEWKRSNQEAQHVLDNLDPDTWMQINYEKLCVSTEDTLRRIFDFLETESKEYCPNFKDVDHHVVGNGMRLDATSEITLDERWKTQLSSDALDTFESIAGQLNRQLGYY